MPLETGYSAPCYPATVSLLADLGKPRFKSWKANENFDQDRGRWAENPNSSLLIP